MKLTAVLAVVIGLIAAATGQPVGNTYVAGNTYYDYQHGGSCGRMIGLDDSGYVHVVWMRAGTWDRHVYYNHWSPFAGAFDFTTGIQVDQSSRAGYTTLAVTGDGCPIQAFHQILSSDVSAHTAVSLCLESTSMPPWRYWSDQSIEIIWPKIALQGDTIVHVVSRENNPFEEPLNGLFYSRGTIITGEGGWPSAIAWEDFDSSGFFYLDSIITSSHAITASRYSSRTAMGWTKYMHWLGFITTHDNDLKIRLSSDAGLTWDERINVTQFTLPDTALYNQGGDWRVCNRDTLRAYTDVSLLFDPEDNLHAAFTVVPYYYWMNDTLGPYTVQGASLIYHWNERSGQFSLIAEGWIGANCGAWQSIVQRPSLALDEETGSLYCAYVRYDTAEVSEAGWYNADVWISVSTDGGSRWSTGTNVTRTAPLSIPAPPGDSRSEREPTLAETVRDGYLHLSYCLDEDAGSSVQEEGTVTLNDFIYQRIPVDSIPTTPLLPNYPLRWDSTGFLGAPPQKPRALPEKFTLDPPFPNPFNSMVRLRFELPRTVKIALKVYDVLGREVETLASGELEAGVHTVSWDAKAQASGMYFVVLSHQGERVTHKIVLLK